MSLTPDEAATTLGEIARTERRSTEMREYAHSGPHFILWGLIWMLGYTGSYLLPGYGLAPAINWLWFALIVLGAVASNLLSFRQIRDQHPAQKAACRAKGLRIGMTFFAVWLFIMATFFVLRPVSPMAVGAWVPLIVALLYSIFGIWAGMRFVYAGIAVAMLTLGGWFFLREHFMLWMALVGGGSLILVGFWLKKV